MYAWNFSMIELRKKRQVVKRMLEKLTCPIGKSMLCARTYNIRRVVEIFSYPNPKARAYAVRLVMMWKFFSGSTTAKSELAKYPLSCSALQNIHCMYLTSALPVHSSNQSLNISIVNIPYQSSSINSSKKRKKTKQNFFK